MAPGNLERVLCGLVHVGTFLAASPRWASECLCALASPVEAGATRGRLAALPHPWLALCLQCLSLVQAAAVLAAPGLVAALSFVPWDSCLWAWDVRCYAGATFLIAPCDSGPGADERGLGNCTRGTEGQPRLQGRRPEAHAAPEGDRGGGGAKQKPAGTCTYWG